MARKPLKDRSSDAWPKSLCNTCVFRKNVDLSNGARYTLCEYHLKDNSYPKYPRQPKISCEGYELEVESE